MPRAVRFNPEEDEWYSEKHYTGTTRSEPYPRSVHVTEDRYPRWRSQPREGSSRVPIPSVARNPFTSHDARGQEDSYPRDANYSRARSRHSAKEANDGLEEKLVQIAPGALATVSVSRPRKTGLEGLGNSEERREWEKVKRDLQRSKRKLEEERLKQRQDEQRAMIEAIFERRQEAEMREKKRMETLEKEKMAMHQAELRARTDESKEIEARRLAQARLQQETFEKLRRLEEEMQKEKAPKGRTGKDEEETRPGYSSPSGSSVAGGASPRRSASPAASVHTEWSPLPSPSPSRPESRSPSSSRRRSRRRSRTEARLATAAPASRPGRPARQSPLVETTSYVEEVEIINPDDDFKPRRERVLDGTQHPRFNQYRERTPYGPSERSSSRSSNESDNTLAEDDSDYDLDFSLKESSSQSIDGYSSTDVHDTLTVHTISPGVPWFRSTPTSYNVIHSQYVKPASSSGMGGEEATGLLSVVEIDGITQEKPLYRWVHFEHSEMSFDAFRQAAGSVKSISESDRLVITEVLDAVRKQQVEKLETPSSITGQHMKPHCLNGTDVVKARAGSNKGRDVLSACFPYFVLEKYQPSKSEGESVLHPRRPLLQSYFPSAKQKLDMQQAVRQLADSRDDRCFHVGQVWFTVVRADLLLTCSHVPIDQLIAQPLEVTVVPQAESSSEKQSGPERKHIRVCEEKARLLWLLPRNQCQTLLEIKSLFRTVEQGLEAAGLHFELRRNKKLLDTVDWKTVLQRSTNLDIQLTLNIVKKPVVHEPRDSELDSDNEENRRFDPTAQSQQSNSPAFGQTEQQRTLSPDTPQRSETQRLSPGHPTPSASQSRLGRGPKSPRSSSASQQPSATFHLFTWTAASDESQDNTTTTDDTNIQVSATTITRDPDAQGSGAGRLQNILEKAEKFILDWQDDPKLRAAYKRLPCKSIDDVKKSIADKTAQWQREGRSVDNYLEKRVRSLVRAAGKILDFYVPSGTESTLLGKFWGAISDIIQVYSEKPFDGITSVVNRLIDEGGKLHTSQQMLSAGRPGLVTDQALDELTKGFLCLLAGLFHASSEGFRSSVVNQYLSRSRTFTLQGIDVLMSGLRRGQFTDYEAVLPFGLMSLIVARLMKDITPGRPDIASTYWDYYKILEFNVESDPYSRVHQSRLSMLKQEISAILFNLNQQELVLRQMRQAYASCKSDSNEIRTTYTPGGDWSAQDVILDGCQTRIANQIRGFEELLDRTAGLQEWNLSQIENNTDRHNNAIYVFTIVTIIFLPLSFVSSFLGMNTVDIRDMGSQQWVFWAAGVPLTIIVISVALIWAGEWDNFGRWLRMQFGSGSSGGVIDDGVNWQVSGKPGRLGGSMAKMASPVHVANRDDAHKSDIHIYGRGGEYHSRSRQSRRY